jgi:hypothetical protein
MNSLESRGTEVIKITYVLAEAILIYSPKERLYAYNKLLR